MELKECNEVYREQIVFNDDYTKRYERTISRDHNKKSERKILVIGLNPASNNPEYTDSTTNYITNNLFPMGYTSITICNLTAKISKGFKITDVKENQENLEYIKSILERKYNTILIGYGSTYSKNKTIINEKKKLEDILSVEKENSNIVELIDKKNTYSRLHTIHPLYAGQRFSGEWKFRKFVF